MVEVQSFGLRPCAVTKNSFHCNQTACCHGSLTKLSGGWPRRRRWTDEKFVTDESYKNNQELLLSEMATCSLLETNWHEAHLDGGSHASTMSDKSLLWGLNPFSNKNPCKIQLMCADGKNPIMPEGHRTVRVLTDDDAECVPVKWCYTPDIPNFILSANSFKPVHKKNYQGCTLNYDNNNKMFQFQVWQKKRDSEVELLCNMTHGGLCWSAWQHHQCLFQKERQNCC